MHRYHCLFAGLMLCFTEQVVSGQSQFPKAEIKLTRAVVKDDETFSVVIVVRNPGSTEQSLIVWDCSYQDQWTSDNPAVRVDDVACMQNVPEKIKLKPGDSYRRSLSVHVHLTSSQIDRKEVTFRLGYGPHAYSAGQNAEPKTPLFWSNAVTVTVTPEVKATEKN
jgi:hypothetical protein